MALTGKKIDSLYRDGVVTKAEATSQAILAAGEFGAERLIADVSDELLSSVREEIATAPKADKEWQDFKWILGGTFMPGFDHEKAAQERTAKYRAGVEALRAHLS